MDLESELSFVFKLARKERYTSQAALVDELQKEGLTIDVAWWDRLERGEILPRSKRVSKLCSVLNLPVGLLTKLGKIEQNKAIAFQSFQSRASGKIRQAKTEEEDLLFQFLPRLIRERSVVEGSILWSSIPVYCSGYKVPTRMRFSIPLGGLLSGWLEGSLHHNKFWLLRFEGGNHSASWVAYDPNKKYVVNIEGMLYHALMGTGPIMKIRPSRAVVESKVRELRGLSVEHMLHRESLGTYLLYNGWSHSRDRLFWADGSTEEFCIDRLSVARGHYLEQIEELRAASKDNWTTERTKRLFDHDRIDFGDLVVTPWSIEYASKGKNSVLMVSNRPLSAPVLMYALKTCREKIKQRQFSLWAQNCTVET